MFPSFRPVADHALLVEFGDTVSNATNDAVFQLDRSLAYAPFDGFLESVPAYCSLLVDFNPLITDHTQVKLALQSLIGNGPKEQMIGGSRDVFVCYDDEFAHDLPEVARLTGQSREDVIASHLTGNYRVHMYGFAPGYAYLAGVPSKIRLPRKDSAVSGIERGSVIIAGPQCLVTTLTMPTGWWVIGRSPTRILTDNDDAPFLFEAGDHVTFKRISRDEYDHLAGTA